MSIPARRMSGSGIRQFPRRKPSQNQAIDSWELVADRSTGISENDDPMDLDVIAQRTYRESSIVGDLVDRISREVELFAEKLDEWKNRDRSTQQQRLDEAHDLIRKYEGEAQAVVSGLHKLRDNEARFFSESWRSCLPEHNAGHEGNNTFDWNNADGTSLQDLRDWKVEQKTWQLAELLLMDDMANSEGNGPCVAFTQEIRHKHADDRFGADGDTWLSFLAQNPEARRTYIILKWLETSAECTGKDASLIEEKLESLSMDKRALFAHGWMNTREKIKNEKRLRLWDVPIDSNLPEIWNDDHTALLVTQLDLDAPARQHKSLDRADAEFENAFWIMCWEMLKRGCTMSALQDWCSEKGQSAVALSLGASSYDDSVDSETNAISRYHWRRVCLQNAIKGTGSIYEKAVYGLLSGDTETVAAVCNSWEDAMYAHYNSLLMMDYSEFVRKNNVSSTVLTPPVDSRANHKALHEDVLQLYDDARQDVDQGYEAKMRVIQGSLMLRHFAQLALDESVQLSMQDYGDSDYLIPTRFAAVRASENLPPTITNDEHVIRIFAHLYILYRDIGIDFGQGDVMLATENLIGKYMSLLRKTGKYQLVPLYASFMLHSRAEMALGVVCKDIIDAGERQNFLRLAESGGFDVVNVVLNHYNLCDINFKAEATEQILRKRVHFLQTTPDILWPGKRIITKKAAELSYEEEDVINSAEWFQAMEGNWATAFGTITRAALRFLSVGHIDAAVALVTRVPSSELSKSKTTPSLGRAVDVFDDMEDSDEEDSLEQVSSPVRRAKQARALTPQRARIHRDLFRQHARIYHEVNQLVEALLSLWEWRRAELKHLNFKNGTHTETKKAIDRVVVAFSPIMDPLFLQQDPTEAGLFLDEGVAQERVQMLEIIRKAYIPELILAFDSAMHSAAHLCTRDFILDCLDLANKVAANEPMTACFKYSGRMHELVDAFAYNSKALLALNQAARGGGRRKGRSGRSLEIWDVSQ